MQQTTDVIVIGGGVIGCSIAYHLARRGAQVALFEQSGLASAASGASAGGVRQQGRDLRELPLAIASNSRWEQLEAELETDVHYYREGHIQVTEDPATLPEMEQRVAAQQAAGLAIDIVRGDDLRTLVPGVTDRAIAGTYTANDGHANPMLTTHAFAAAARRLGVRIFTETRVTEIEHDAQKIQGVVTTAGRFSCDWLVLAAGAWSTGLAQQLQIDLPVKPVGLQMMSTDPMPSLLHQVLGAMGRRLSLKQVRSGNYIIGGGWPGDVNLATDLAIPRLDSIRGSIRDASTIFPTLRQSHIQRVWVGIEAVASDGVPILGSVPMFDNLALATGFSGHGFALSPMIGQTIAEVIVDGTPSISLDSLKFDRIIETHTNHSDALFRVG